MPGLVRFRRNEQIFFANGEIFRQHAKAAVAASPTLAQWLIAATGAITDIDVTAAESRAELHRGLQRRGVEL